MFRYFILFFPRKKMPKKVLHRKKKGGSLKRIYREQKPAPGPGGIPFNKFFPRLKGRGKKLPPGNQKVIEALRALYPNVPSIGYQYEYPTPPEAKRRGWI